MRACIAGLLLLLLPHSASAYLELSSDVRGQTVPLRWATTTPVRWYVTDRGVPGISVADVQSAIAKAFATWQAVPTSAIAFEFAGFTNAEPFDDDDVSTLGFQSHPEMERVLGATGFVVDELTGDIIESDVFFNSAFPWSVNASADASAFDLQSTATHEIGHFLGLGHSALGETELRPDGGRRVIASGAVMFPISFGRGRIDDRQLQRDDIVGASNIYPEATFRSRTGAIRGRVLHAGRPVFGAHVLAFNPDTGDVVGSFSLDAQGSFQIAGLTPGAYVVRVEPLDDADVESFFDTPNVDVNFAVTFYPQLVVVPAGGVGQDIEVSLRSK